jgi:homoserine dehydrogenase
MSEVMKIAIAGVGTVGAETIRILKENATLLTARTGRPIEVVAVSARDRSRDRKVDLSGIDWCDSALDLAARDDVEVVVELIGGSEGIAKDLVEAALGMGKSVVTANKALVAHHGAALGRAAEKNDAVLAYESAVAGGIPIIKTLREGLSANRIERIYGILNGTCNYILTVMRETGRPFADVLADAQDLGYAESDPAFDIDGVDAAHKLAILSAIAFGSEIDFDAVDIEGIRHVAPIDLEFAEELGYRIKLLGIAERTASGVQQRVRPCMVPKAAQIAQVEGVFNAVAAEGSSVGPTLSYGRGAGGGPTASAVIADLVDIGAGRRTPVFGVPCSVLQSSAAAPIDSLVGSYYLRLTVFDRPGVLADLTAVFRDEQVSVEAMIQRSRDPNELVPVVLITHETKEAAIRRSVAKINKLDSVTEEPRILRIEAI